MTKAALTLLMLAGLAAADPAPAATRRPVLVELFTAQGCSSCGAADSLGVKLADRPGVVFLTWPVDYWDYLGWKDTFAAPAFTERQRAYDHRLGLRGVFTPQVIVGGAAQTSGDKPDEIDALLAARPVRSVGAPKIHARAGGRVAVGSGHAPHGGAEVWLIRYDPRERDTQVTSGDNRGAVMAQRNVVRQYERLGYWRGRPVVLATPPASEKGLSTVILVQGAKGGPVLAMDGPAPAAH